MQSDANNFVIALTLIKFHTWKSSFIYNCIAAYPNLVTESPKYAKSRDFREERVFSKNVITCVKNLTRKLEEDLTTYLVTEMQLCLQTFTFFKLFLPLDRSCTCFKDGSL